MFQISSWFSGICFARFKVCSYADWCDFALVEPGTLHMQTLCFLGRGSALSSFTQHYFSARFSFDGWFSENITTAYYLSKPDDGIRGGATILIARAEQTSKAKARGENRVIFEGSFRGTHIHIFVFEPSVRICICSEKKQLYTLGSRWNIHEPNLRN